MPGSRNQIFTVVEGANRLPVLAVDWEDALDIYAQIYGFDDYTDWRRCANPGLSVYDRYGRVRPVHLL